MVKEDYTISKYLFTTKSWTTVPGNASAISVSFGRILYTLTKERRNFIDGLGIQKLDPITNTLEDIPEQVVDPVSIVLDLVGVPYARE